MFSRKRNAEIENLKNDAAAMLAAYQSAHDERTALRSQIDDQRKTISFLRKQVQRLQDKIGRGVVRHHELMREKDAAILDREFRIECCRKVFYATADSLKNCGESLR